MWDNEPFRSKVQSIVRPGGGQSTNAQQNDLQPASSEGDGAELEAPAEENEDNGNSSGSEEERAPRRVIGKQQGMRVPPAARQTIQQQAESIIGKPSYRILTEMVPMMRDLLEDHVSPEHLNTFLDHYMDQLNTLIIHQPKEHN
jgi:hypothetical protein